MTRRFDEAVTRWTELHQSEDANDFEALEAAEKIILKHRPRNPVQAEAISKVLDFNLQTGERFDGLDHTAIENLAALRLTSANIQSLAAWQKLRRPPVRPPNEP